jgi:rhamnose transport system permease protein
MSRLRRSLEPLVRRREWGLMAAIGAVAILVSLADARFLAWQNLQDLLLRAAPTVIVACGVTLVVVTAEIDISV